MQKKIEYEENSDLSVSSNESDNDHELTKKFEKDYALIKKMRKDVEAPVDTMGSALCPDNKIKKVDYKTYKFQALVSLILSAQTKDHITFQTTQKLIKYGLTIQSMIDTSADKIVELIYGVSFHNNKAKSIKHLAQEIRNKYDDDPPESLEEVVKLKGIGYKMALIYLKDVCGKVEGIAVDTHIHKIANRLGWTETKNAEKTRKQLESIVDKKYWEEMNPILVGFGKEICKSVKPKCDECLLIKECLWYKEEKKRKEEEEKEKKKKKELSKGKKQRKTK